MGNCELPAQWKHVLFRNEGWYVTGQSNTVLEEEWKGGVHDEWRSDSHYRECVSVFAERLAPQ
jgi:hypothetical protein